MKRLLLALLVLATCVLLAPTGYSPNTSGGSTYIPRSVSAPISSGGGDGGGEDPGSTSCTLDATFDCVF